MFCLADELQQLSLVERISKLEALPRSDPIKFLNLLKEHIDLPTFIPHQFYEHYHSSDTNTRDYPLESILSILLLAHFFKFSTQNFLIMLSFSPELQKFCRLDGSIPSASVISKFKITFSYDLLFFFNNVVPHVIDIFTEYNNSLPDDSPLKDLNENTIYDTTGLKPKVKENNPKFIAAEIKRQSNYKKYLNSKGEGKDFNIYAAAYKNLPKQASANSAIKLDYANGHFGYFYKFGMVSNGFGTPLNIHFLDEDFYKNIPDEFDSMEEQKRVSDNASLRPVITSFSKHMNNNRFTTFIGDSEFDSYDNYSFLHNCGFEKILIPINPRNSKQSKDISFPLNHENVPCCPRNSLPFIAAGPCKGKNRSLRLKFVCPLSTRVKGKWSSNCEDTCRETNSTVTTYVYPNGDLRVFPGIQRGSDEWNENYKIRTVIEREFSSLKSNPAIDRPNTYNLASMRSDVFLSAITKLFTVILAFAVGQPQYMSNLRKLLTVA